ncbi:MAG: glycosyltransferase family 4 protein [Notoacmeibacter sp.]|nr:glycosyltransferase family 4 protein [Notoacmeibacter sp.]
MKTIAYVLNDFPVLSETFIGNEIRAMELRGHRVIPFVFNLKDGPAQAEDGAIARRAIRVADIGNLAGLRMAARASRASAFVARQEKLPRRSLMWNAMKLAGAISSAGCDHIHAHFAGGGAAHAIAAGKITGLPVSFTCHGHDVYAEPEDLEAKLGEAHRVVAVCADLENDLRRMEGSARIVRIACGTDTDRFLPRPDHMGDNGRLLFVGRLVEQKGIDDLLAALLMIGGRTTIRLDIVGDGPLRDSTARSAEMIAARHGHDIRMLGARDAAWLRAEAKAYMGVVLPFKEAPDGSRDTGPLVVKEAMAMGLPVISTAFMGVKETVTEKTGILVAPGDPAALCDAIARLVAMSPLERRAMGTHGRRRVVAGFTIGEQARALSAMVEAA